MKNQSIQIQQQLKNMESRLSRETLKPVFVAYNSLAIIADQKENSCPSFLCYKQLLGSVFAKCYKSVTDILEITPLQATISATLSQVSPCANPYSRKMNRATNVKKNLETLLSEGIYKYDNEQEINKQGSYFIGTDTKHEALVFAIDFVDRLDVSASTFTIGTDEIIEHSRESIVYNYFDSFIMGALLFHLMYKFNVGTQKKCSIQNMVLYINQFLPVIDKLYELLCTNSFDAHHIVDIASKESLLKASVHTDILSCDEIIDDDLEILSHYLKAVPQATLSKKAQNLLRKAASNHTVNNIEI